MKTRKLTTNVTLDYICEGRDFGDIDTGFGVYGFIRNENKLRMYDGYGWSFVIQIENRDANIYYKDEEELAAALNIL